MLTQFIITIILMLLMIGIAWVSCMMLFLSTTFISGWGGRNLTLPIFALYGLSIILSVCGLFFGVMVFVNMNNQANAMDYFKYLTYAFAFLIIIWILFTAFSSVNRAKDNALNKKYEDFMEQYNIHLTENNVLTLKGKGNNTKNITLKIYSLELKSSGNGQSGWESIVVFEKKYETLPNETETFKPKELLKNKDFLFKVEMYPDNNEFFVQYSTTSTTYEGTGYMQPIMVKR